MMLDSDVDDDMLEPTTQVNLKADSSSLGCPRPIRHTAVYRNTDPIIFKQFSSGLDIFIIL